MWQLNKTVHAMSGMQCVVYALEHKVFAATSHSLLVITKPTITLSRDFAINVVI